MQPYWITIIKQAEPAMYGLQLGAGVTAISESDARKLFEAAFGTAYQIAQIHPITDMREIEQNHVRPNMGNWFMRGIWFPLGFDHLGAETPPVIK